MANRSGNKKPENTRWNLLLILDVLKRYTNEEHPMPASEICEKVSEEFKELTSGDNSNVMSADTVKRTLDSLIYDYFEKHSSDRKDNRNGKILGFKVGCFKKTKKGYEKYAYDEEKNPKGLKKYYYYEGEFSSSEVRMLIDVIETHYYFSEEDVAKFAKKLSDLPSYNYKNRDYYDSAKESRYEDSLLWMNIDDLYGIIANQNYAEIKYCYYNEKKELVARPGYPKVVEPLKVIWSNGYCYLLAYNDKHKSIVNYRVDRISFIQEKEADKEHKKGFPGRKEFNPVKYRAAHPIMYGGETEHFVLLCRDTGKNYVVNTIMDVFGNDTRISRAEDKLIQEVLGHEKAYYDEQGITWLKVSFESAPGGVEMFATQYCTDFIIVSPEESKQRVRKRLQEGLENYGIS